MPCCRHPLLVLLLPGLLLVPRSIECWVTDELTVHKASNKIQAYKQRVHNIPTVPTLLRWLLGLVASFLLMWGFGW